MDGILIINKEKEYTSHDVVAIVKKMLQEKVGHTGTLDPLATGVLPLLIGKATKISKYLTNHDKQYRAVLKLGMKTDTADITGKMIEKQEIKETITEKQINQVFSSLLGKQLQMPPMYSAIKVKGKKLYEYARKGEAVEVEPRQIEIYQILLENVNMVANEITFVVTCSKGTYIRTLCETIAETLGTIGCMKELTRLQVGQFSIQDSITIEQLKQQQQVKEEIEQKLISIESILENKKRIILEEKTLALFLNGVKLKTNQIDGIVTIYNAQNQFIGTAEIKEGMLKRDVILNS